MADPSPPLIDPEKYGKLLAEIRPGIIETQEEHDRLIAIAESMIERAEPLEPEAEKVLALLTLLIEAYESGYYGDDEDEDEASAEPVEPHHTLRRLMDARGLQISDVVDVFGNPSAAREVLEGRRPISRGQANQLGRLFQVPPKLFQA